MKTRQAFTLVELLVVVAIMVLLLALVGPAVTGMLQGSQLTQAGELVQAQLDLARQEAIAQNATVQVRFYQFADPGSPGQGTLFQAMQAFAINNVTGAVPLGKMYRLPQGTIIDRNTALSSILNSATRTENTAPTYSIPVAGTKYNYFEVQFYPDGSPDLPIPTNATAQNWFLTIHKANAGDNLSTPPSNFWTIQIDPYNGVSKNYRP
jgi:uncharacterized protein (TIGR02596 family)